jgi:hypothetical protein
MILGQLHVVFRQSGLPSGGDTSINPFRPIEPLPASSDLLARQNIWNLQQHLSPHSSLRESTWLRIAAVAHTHNDA